MKRVLVIDDNDVVSSAIEIMLARQGYEAVLAPDAHSGLQAFESAEFDVVLVDIFMPGADGFETIRIFRQRVPTIPIVVMAGAKFSGSLASTPDYLRMATKLGATCCLRKPFESEQLMVAINACFHSTSVSDRSFSVR